MMKKIIHYLVPLLFALSLFFFYIMIYPLPSPVELESENVATAILVFFTALGSGAVIILSGQKNKFPLYFYLSVSIGCPLLLLLFFNLFHTVQLKVIFGCQVIGIFWLKIFVSAHLKHQEKSSVGSK
jgi:hypothetical protein